MVTAPSTLNRQHGLLLLPAIARLASWRFKNMWRFLFVTWLGMLAMVVLVCALPLFSRVAISADLRATAASSPDGQNILVRVVTTAPTQAQLQNIGQQLDHLLRQQSFGAYLQGAPSVIVQAPLLDVLVSGTRAPTSLILDGYDAAQASQHVAVVQGRRPSPAADGSVEIALTQAVATNLGLHVGSVLHGSYANLAAAHALTVRVVGLIAPASASDSFWVSLANPFGSRFTAQTGPNTFSTSYSVLATADAVTNTVSGLQLTGEKAGLELYWRYPFNLAHLDATNIPALSQQASDLQSSMNTTLTHIQGVTFAYPFGSLFDTFSTYAVQTVILEIVITLLLLIILAIVLFLVSMTSDMLVERQAAIIATLRSRGATRRHIFGAFVGQGLLLGLAALLLGPFLAILLVRGMAQALFSSLGQQSLDVITNTPVQSALDVKWYAVSAVIVSLFVMILAIYRASKLDIVTLRQEAARTKRVSFWRRLNLDLVLALLVILGYIAYTYFWQTLAATQQIDPVFYGLFRGLGFIAPPLLVAALLMLFLRLFPLLVRLATFLAGKKRSAAAVLALAQMARASRPATRVIILLALSIAAACFLLTLTATKEQRAIDAATFAVGADFSGPLPAADSSKTFSQLKTQYSHMAGVQSASIGYVAEVEPGPSNRLSGPTHIIAVDADTYAATALWPAQNSVQPLATLAARLAAHRQDATTSHVTYALVDASLWQQLQLSPGANFTLPVDDSGSLQMHFVALAEVNDIPGLYDTPLNFYSGVGLLVDYQSFATDYDTLSGQTLTPNAVALRTHSDAASLTHIRQALPGLQDRRALEAANQQNGVHLDIVGVLVIGVGAALILALLGTLLSSWLDASNRRTSFAVVRALGMAPRQVAAVLLWEQGFIYVLAFLLGIGLGALLTVFVTPIVSLLDLAGQSAQYNPYDVPPVQAMLPYPQLLLVLGGLLVMCLVALVLMARIVSRPSLGQTLRLNED